MSRTGASGRTPSTSGGDGSIRVLLLDAQLLVREGLRALLSREPGVEIVGDAVSIDEARRVAGDIDVAITELELRDARGVDVVARLRALDPSVAVLVVTAVDHPSKVEEAIAAGAKGYLRKSATAEELVGAVHALADGGSYLQPSLGMELALWHGNPGAVRTGNGNGNGNGSAPPVVRLSEREQAVLRLVALGHTNAEIGTLLAMSLRTVEAHRGRILHKLGRRTRAELVRYAHEAGLVAAG